MMGRTAPVPTSGYENLAQAEGFKFIAGVDEVGRGPLAGPVMAAAVILPSGYVNPHIRDSKKLSATKRESLYRTIMREALAVGFGLASPEVIDEINILEATRVAMAQAVSSLSVRPDCLLIDGTTTLAIPLPQRAIIGGDNLSISIAAASIVAKVTRDLLMETYHTRYPAYNFARNKGYGTLRHRQAIAASGLCAIHRRSFCLAREVPEGAVRFDEKR
jgi:ribonuclease HII